MDRNTEIVHLMEALAKKHGGSFAIRFGIAAFRFMIGEENYGKLAEKGQAFATHFSTGTDRLLAAQDRIGLESLHEMFDRLSDGEREVQPEQREAFERRINDPEALGVLARYMHDVYFEPLVERRRLLEHASAGLANMHLSIADNARVQRILRELDDEDVLVLHGLWLIPRTVPGDGRTPETLAFQLWQQTAADALLASGCVQTGFWSGLGGGRPELTITRTGILVLRAARSYLATRRATSDLPIHQGGPDYRGEAEARAVIAAIPNLSDVLLRNAAPRFSRRMQYDAPGANEKPPIARAKAKLITPDLKQTDVGLLVGFGEDEAAQSGEPVNGIWIRGTGPEGNVLHIHGPHDVLRFLAYDVDAVWA